MDNDEKNKKEKKIITVDDWIDYLKLHFEIAVKTKLHIEVLFASVLTFFAVTVFSFLTGHYTLLSFIGMLVTGSICIVAFKSILLKEAISLEISYLYKRIIKGELTDAESITKEYDKLANLSMKQWREKAKNLRIN